MTTGDADDDDTIVDHYLEVAVAAAGRRGGADRRTATTQADRAQERAVVDRHVGGRHVAGGDLRGHRRVVPGPRDPRRGGHRWDGGIDHTSIVDPLDGTSDYAHGLRSRASRSPFTTRTASSSARSSSRSGVSCSPPLAHVGAWLSERPWRRARGERLGGFSGRLAGDVARVHRSSSPMTRTRSRPTVGGSSPSTRRLAETR